MKIIQNIFVFKLGDGLITESEFLSWLSKIKTHKDNDIIEDLTAAFLVFDVDKNGLYHDLDHLDDDTFELNIHLFDQDL